MIAGARSAVTLAVLAVLLVVGAAWGWAALTEPFPDETAAAACVPTTVAAGDQISVGQVTVSVLNAGTREGLAGRTMSLFTEAGFVEGDLDNAPDDTDVPLAQIWTDQPGTAAVRMVRSWLPEGTTVERRDATTDPTTGGATGDGVVVVVGDQFQELRQGRDAVTARQDTEICSPPDS